MELSSHHHINDQRFFANSSLFKVKSNNQSGQKEDPVPLGLSLQENFAVERHLPAHTGGTMGPSPTNTITGSDSCLDIDIEF